MIRSFSIVIAALAIAACTGEKGSNADPATALRAADAALTEAVTKGDLERIMSFYADDAVLMPMAEETVTGKAAIRDEWKHVLGIPGLQTVSALKQVDVSRSGDMGYSRGIYTSRMVGSDGSIVSEPGKWLTVWKKRDDGNWHIVVETYNTDIMPPVHKPSTADAH